MKVLRVDWVGVCPGGSPLSAAVTLTMSAHGTTTHRLYSSSPGLAKGLACYSTTMLQVSFKVFSSLILNSILCFPFQQQKFLFYSVGLFGELIMRVLHMTQEHGGALSGT